MFRHHAGRHASITSTPQPSLKPLSSRFPRIESHHKIVRSFYASCLSSLQSSLTMLIALREEFPDLRKHNNTLFHSIAFKLPQHGYSISNSSTCRRYVANWAPHSSRATRRSLLGDTIDAEKGTHLHWWS